MDCGKVFHPSVMQFDHRRGDKKFNLADAPGQDKAIDEVLEEIDKCDLVCANCHALKSFAERNDYDVVRFLLANGVRYQGYKNRKRRLRWLWTKILSIFR